VHARCVWPSRGIAEALVEQAVERRHQPLTLCHPTDLIAPGRPLDQRAPGSRRSNALGSRRSLARRTRPLDRGRAAAIA